MRRADLKQDWVMGEMGERWGTQGHAQRKGLSRDISLRWGEWGLDMQRSGTELTRQKRAGVRAESRFGVW